MAGRNRRSNWDYMPQPQKALQQPKKGAKSTAANATNGERLNSATALV
jgi:hypothetical protein